jgi:hypothetical protein
VRRHGKSLALSANQGSSAAAIRLTLRVSKKVNPIFSAYFVNRVSGTTRACFSRVRGYFSAVSKIEEIELALEQLPLTDFVKVAVWVGQRCQQLALSPEANDKSQGAVRDHSAFLSSYAPQDEGLYDDATSR